MSQQTHPVSSAFHRGSEQKGKRTQTLARLLDTAVTLFAQKGIDATSVLDITTEAGVANGTFYNYFKDKTELVDTIYDGITETLVKNIIGHLDRIVDPTEQVALGTIWFLDAVSRDPHWGSMMLEMLEQPTPFREACRSNIGKYVAHGVEQQRFAVDGIPNLLDFNLSLLAGSIRLRLETGREDPTDIALEAAEVQLRMLGMSAGEARAIPSRARQAHGDCPAGGYPELAPNLPRHGAAPASGALSGRGPKP